MEVTTKRILFFDGVCKLCHRTVDWFLPLYNPGQIYFAPLQGSTAKKTLQQLDLNLDSVVYSRDGQIYRKSQALIWLIADSNSRLKKPIIMFHALPITLLDWFYDLIAGSRYTIFGQTDSCRIPTSEEKKYFLD
jgi:predicted DCC family thiol-disulfide oxidoreductase YuxK